MPTATATDRLRPLAAAHAESLTGDSIAAARETGVPLLAAIEALADW